MKNTNDLFTNVLKAIIPVIQEYVDQQTIAPGTQMSILNEKPKNLTQKTFQKISRETRYKTNEMIKMVDLKIKGKNQTEIAEACDTSQSRVSMYLRAFKNYYQQIKEAA